jgi:hypothetical protein
MNMVDANSGAAPQPGGYAGPGSAERGHAVPQAEVAGLESQAPEESELVDLEQVVEEINGPRPTEEVSDAGNSRAPQRAEDEPEAEADGEAEGEGEGESEDYSGEEWSHDALKAEIDKRNEGREDDDHISKGGSSDDLRARLVEDDAAQADS